MQTTKTHGMHPGVPCHVCGHPSGYDRKEIILGGPRLRQASPWGKFFFGICGSCYHCTPTAKTLDELDALIKSGPLMPGPTANGDHTHETKCMWCATDGVRDFYSGERAWVQLKLQSVPIQFPMKKLDVAFGICKKCQHCMPTTYTRQVAELVAKAGPLPETDDYGVLNWANNGGRRPEVRPERIGKPPESREKPPEPRQGGDNAGPVDVGPAETP